MSSKLIVGLGNPGRKYERTRHNIGWGVVKELASELGATFDMKGRSAKWAEVPREGNLWVIAKPLRFMNRSGEAVAELVKRYGIPWESEMLVVVDDADLEFGRFRLREKGTSGGHRGLESIIGTLGSVRFHRFRVGVGRPDRGAISLEDYVLQPFSKEEREQLPEILIKARAAVQTWAEEGSRAVMNRYNA